jgi:tetratricopeptide (TPR) repeat protein
VSADRDELADTEVGAADTRASDESITKSRPPPSDAKVGRFVVVAQLGSGGMGIVFSAYDPHLDRKVAIKMLHDEISDTHGPRLEREAKAMAQLSHPNVVTVHETGTFEGRLYIAMELVDGQTLRGWLRAKPRTHDEILDVIVQAGRGLAAAHAGGLVHRDFKPDNVLVGNDGRARVSDFGLVSSALDAPPTLQERPSAKNLMSPGSLTLTGSVIGTPLYMAPEQHRGRLADAKADQFAFCVTLWQALTDDLPYGAETYEDLVENVSGGKLRPFPKGVRVAPKLRAILARGLSSDPADRYPSMQALLDAIERARRKPRWPYVAAGGVVLAAAAVAGTLVLRGGDRDPCPPATERVGAVWGAARATALEIAFKGAEAAEGAAVWTGVRGDVDKYTKTWLERRREVCLATRVRGEQSQELFDLRVHCLDGHLGELDALLGQLAHIERATLYKARDASAALPALTDCDDVERMRAAIPLPVDPAARAKISELERRFADVGALDRMGRHAAAMDLVVPLVADAEHLGYPPLIAKAVLLRAGEEFSAGDLATAEKSYRESAAAAARAKDDERIAQSWIDLMQALAMNGRIPDALALVDIARASADRADRPRLSARFENVLAGVYLQQGKYPDAKVEYERALAFVKKDGPDSDLLGHALLNFGEGLWYTGDIAGAEKYMEQSRQEFVTRFGPHHPSLGYVHRALGDLALAKNDVNGAIPHYVEAASVFELANGPDHVDNAIALEPLAYSYARQGDFRRAREVGLRALALRENKYGKDHISLITSLNALADADVAEGTPAALAHAMELLERALAIQEKVGGKVHPQLPGILDRMMEVARKQGKAAEAKAYFARAEEIRKAVSAAAAPR